MIFSHQDLQEHFGKKLIAKATTFLKRHPLRPDVMRNGQLVTCLVRDKSESLRVYIKSERKRVGRLIIQGDCACQQPHCVHVAAVMLSALPTTNITASAPDAPLTAVAESTSCLLYLVALGDGLPRRLNLRVVSARVSKFGEHQNIQPWKPEWVHQGHLPRFITAEDQPILKAVTKLPSDVFKERYNLSDYQGAQLLAEIIATGRAHLGNPGTPLSLGPARTAELQWDIKPNGDQVQQWQLDPMLELLEMQPQWYLDPQAKCAGPLKSRYSLSCLKWLQQHPELTPGQSHAFCRELNERFAEEGVPAPRPLRLKTQPSKKPRPLLYLCPMKTGLDPLQAALVGFIYGDYQITADDPISRVLDQDQVIEITRNPDQERRRLQQLEETGLLPTPRTGLYGFSDNDHLIRFQQQQLPALRKKGWQIEFAPDFNNRLVQVQEWRGQIQPQNEGDWFDIGLGLLVDGEEINLLPLLLTLLRELPQGRRTTAFEGYEDQRQVLLELGEGRVSIIPFGRVRRILEVMLELYDDQQPLDANGQLSMGRAQAMRLAELGDDGIAWRGELEVLEMAERLRQVRGIAPASLPLGLNAELRPYQLQGLNWLQFLAHHRLAGVLADDMGLGKTLQVLSHILAEQEAGRLDRPALVIAPTSLISNWKREAQRFTPDLKILVLQGPERKSLFHQIPHHQLVITTYPLLNRDGPQLKRHTYHLLILDEAQLIKNHRSQASQMVRQFSARHRLCVTGTPLENHLGELWSLFDFLLPGFLGSQRLFRQLFRNPVEKEQNQEVAQQLARRIRPFLLRRTKEEVATELPPKTEIIRSVQLEGPQRDLYESIRLSAHQRVKAEIAEKGLSRSHIVILDALMKLRQVCCDPRLVKLEQARTVTGSAKLEMLMALLPEMIEEGRRVLIFSQFTTMLGIIEQELKKHAIDYAKLTGQTKNRSHQIDRFQQGDAPVFLISLKAGGVGLNLTAADTVIHYDPWWNPAVERQATDRAHRIGQQRPVFVYKLIGENTLEEKIQAMQQSKQQLADSLLNQDGGSAPGWSEEDLETLFAPLPD